MKAKRCTMSSSSMEIGGNRASADTQSGFSNLMIFMDVAIRIKNKFNVSRATQDLFLFETKSDMKLSPKFHIHRVPIGASSP